MTESTKEIAFKSIVDLNMNILVTDSEFTNMECIGVGGSVTFQEKHRLSLILSLMISLLHISIENEAKL